MSRENLMKRDAEMAEAVQRRPAVAPAVDVYENKDELLILADVPGVTREQMTLHLDKGKLTIEAKRTETRDGSPLAAEYRAFDYRRTFLVPQGIEADKIVAELDQGVLKVHLPKAAALKPRQIQIRAE
jgi:HSP20 family molecular chaperone IbpA